MRIFSWSDPSTQIFEHQYLNDGGSVVRAYTALVQRESLGRQDRILNKLRIKVVSLSLSVRPFVCLSVRPCIHIIWINVVFEKPLDQTIGCFKKNIGMFFGFISPVWKLQKLFSNGSKKGICLFVLNTERPLINTTLPRYFLNIMGYMKLWKPIEDMSQGGFLHGKDWCLFDYCLGFNSKIENSLNMS